MAIAPGLIHNDDQGAHHRAVVLQGAPLLKAARLCPADVRAGETGSALWVEHLRTEPGATDRDAVGGTAAQAHSGHAWAVRGVHPDRPAGP